MSGMKIGAGVLRARRALVMVAMTAAVALLAACSAETTVSQTGDAAAAEPTASSSVDQVEPTAAPQGEGAEATPSEPDSGPTVDPGADPEPTAVEPTAAPETPVSDPGEQRPSSERDLVPADFNTENVLAISSDGSYAFAGTTSPWATETPCDAASFESLAFVDIESAVQGDLAPAGAGLEQAGDVRQMIVGPDHRVVMVSSCGPNDAATVWMQTAVIAADGALIEVGDRVPLGADGESDPYLLRWVDADTVELRVIIEDDPDDFDTWIVERRQVAVSTGEVLSTEVFGFFDDDSFAGGGAEYEVGGYTYRVIADPQGRFGCEGLGEAKTLEIDRGVDSRVALTQSDLVFSTVDDLHATASGYIAWTSGCEGFSSAFVGKIGDDGLILDAHLVDTYALEDRADGFTDYWYFRLTDDDRLAAAGQRWVDGAEGPEPAFLLYDLTTDPNFVNTAVPAVDIDEEPLFDAIEDGGFWHVGETLAENRACGGRTLYGRNVGGFVRAFPAGIELDAIVDVDLAEIRTVEYDEGDDYVSRTVVVSTECSGDYDGRRVWWGIESDNLVWGLTFQPVDLGEVEEVLSVRDVVEPGTDFVETSIVEVRLFDGTIVETELR